MKKFKEVIPGTLATIFQKNCENIVKSVGVNTLKEYTRAVTKFAENKESNKVLEDYIMGKTGIPFDISGNLKEELSKVNPYQLKNYTQVVIQFIQDFPTSFEEIFAAMTEVTNGG